MNQRMTPAANRVLADAIQHAPQLELPAGGWQHFLTSMSDGGTSSFAYDNQNGRMIRVTVTAGTVTAVEQPHGPDKA